MGKGSEEVKFGISVKQGKSSGEDFHLEQIMDGCE